MSKELTAFSNSLLQFNREMAGRMGLDPRYTISTNVAMKMSEATNLTFAEAKAVFHGGAALATGASLKAMGASDLLALGACVALFIFLEGFDSASSQQ